MRAFGRLLCLLLLALGPTACVTTTTGGFSADREKEISERVDAATQYLAKGNTEQAVVHLRRALELDPNAAPVHETLARVFVQTGEYELAEQHFRRAIQAEPAYTRARNNYAAFLYQRGDIDGAIRELELVTADTLYEKRADAFSNLGRAYARRGDLDKASEMLGRALRMDRRQAPAMLELADIHFK
ncbi:MAG: tetratricopeptide repeat protein, partial [Gammaproteobacteria bacterium]